MFCVDKIEHGLHNNSQLEESSTMSRFPRQHRDNKLSRDKSNRPLWKNITPDRRSIQQRGEGRPQKNHESPLMGNNTRVKTGQRTGEL